MCDIISLGLILLQQLFDTECSKTNVGYN